MRTRCSSIPSTSLFVIRLSSSSEAAELNRRAAKYTLPYFQVHRAKMILFDRLVEQVMTRPPYNDARRVFWIVDNCSAHRGSRAAQRLQSRYPTIVLVHAPIHASWLNQVEIYFSIVQRKVLTPNDFPDSTAWQSGSLTFSTTGKRRLNRLNGSSLGKT